MRSLPLTAAQEGVWFAQALDPGSPAFVTAERIVLTGAVDVALLAAAIRATVDEAQGLHVRFTEEDGALRQETQEPGGWPLPVVDLRAEPDPAAAADAWTTHHVAQPIDPAQDPLFGEALLRVADDRVLWVQRVHHVAVDAAGLGLLGRRAAERYTAAIAGAAPPAAWFPPLADVVAADAAYRASPAAARDRDFWAGRWPQPARHLATLTDRPPAAPRGVHRASVALPPALLDALRAAAARTGASWPEVVIAAAGTYVARLTAPATADDEPRDVVLGVPLAARLGPVALRSPATLVNILPLRVATDAAADRPDDVVRAVSGDLRAIRRHQRHRGEELRRSAGALGAGRRLHGPLVNVLPFDQTLRFGAADATVQTLGAGPVDELSFNVYDRGDQPARLDVEANDARFTAAEVRLHAGRMLGFLAAFAAPDAPAVGALELLDPEERALVVERFNATAHPLPDVTLDDLLRHAAEREPGAVALRCAGVSTSFAELHEQAGALAGRLAALGAGPGTVVAVAVPRSEALLVALLAVLRSGAAYLPLDPDYPAGRLAMMIEDAAPVAALVDSGLHDLLPWPGGLPRLDPSADVGGPTARITPPAPTDPAYVIFTSGSTGRPKGVVVPHRAIVNRLLWMQDAFSLQAGDRVLQKTPVGFDVSVWELFWPLVAGVPLVIAPPGLHRDPAGLAALIDREAVTTAHFVPSMLALFVDEPGPTRCPSLHRVICSGEALPADLQERFLTRFGAELHNLYGPTEAAVDVTHWPCAEGRGEPAVPIGRPIWNTRAYVLDGQRRPLPIGVAGELHLAGVQLADGYAGRPDLTAAAFVPDPFVPGERMYRTGDLARWRPDGALDFLGRLDHQVKLRGQRIETTEIEARLHEDASVAQAAVVARSDGPGGPRLVAYVVPAAGAAGPPDPQRLRAALARTLPEAMLPAAFVTLPALPLTPSGKLDRRALPAPGQPPAQARARPPATPQEEVVCAVFAELLGLPAFGTDEDFFLAGGHSLLAAAAAARLRAALGVPVTIGTVFAAPTPAALAARLQAGDHDALDPLLRLRDGDERPPLFCVHPAGGIGWCYTALARQLEPGQAVYALQAPALRDADAAPPASIAALARGYAAAIRRVQPAGPYRLLGWSVGGVIAHALAVHLRAQGEAVELLAILDAYPSDQWRDLAAPTEAEALVALLNMAGQGPDALGGRPATRARVVTALRERGSALASLEDRTVAAMIDVVARNARLMREHDHERFDGDADLFVATAPRPETWLDPAGWAAHLGGELRVHELDCTHPEIVGAPVAAQIARALDARLRGAVPAGASAGGAAR